MVFHPSYGELKIDLLTTLIHDYFHQVFQHKTMITNIHPNYRHLQDFAFVFEQSVILHILLVTSERFIAVVYPLLHYRVTKSVNPPFWKTFLV